MPLEQFEYKHPKKISLGLFTRAFLFLFLTGLISLLIWLGAVLYGQHGHKALVISNRVMSAYNLSANALNYVKPELQHIFIDKFNTLGDIEISERFDSDVIKPIPHTRLWRIIEADLREKIDDKNLIISPEVNGVKGLWVSRISHLREKTINFGFLSQRYCLETLLSQTGLRGLLLL